MYAVTSPDGLLVAVRATIEEANEAVIADVLKLRGDGIPGFVDPLISFVDPGQLDPEQALEFRAMMSGGAAEYYNYKIELLAE